MTQHVEVPGGVTAPAGFLAAGLCCGIKDNDESDLALIVSDRPAMIAGMFTRNIVKAAPVLHTQEVVSNGSARAVLVNSGNANAVTGKQGRQDAATMARVAAEYLGISHYEVAVASTGTIGKMLPMENIVAGIRKLVPELSRHGGDDASIAILTTDTFAKNVAVKVSLSQGEAIIGGMAKGAGMICPDLATMLAFITTDAPIELAFLSRALETAVESTFNCITVDGDTSTNDMVLMLANGASEAPQINEFSEDYFAFHSALQYVCSRLAEMIVSDGEGATKLVRIRVVGAGDKTDALAIAKTVANSLLVKTAIFGNDANWGRIIAAAGRAGVEVNPDEMDIHLGDLALLKDGTPQPFEEERARDILSRKEVEFTINLNAGNESATVLTCDLSYDYVKINASYRT